MAKKRATAARKSPGRKTPRKKKAVKKKAVTRKKATAKKASKRTRKAASRKAPPATTAPAPSDGQAADNVVDINRGVELSISGVSRETGMTRETVSKRLAEAGVQPSGKRQGYPVYRLRDILPALYQSHDGEFDPDRLDPFKRRAFYQGEHDKLMLQVKRGELVSSFEVEQEIGKLFKILAHRLDTLPDTLERDVGLGAKQLEHVERKLDECREELYRDVVAEHEDADSAAEERA